MAEPTITTIRLDGSKIFLVGLLLNNDQKLPAFLTLKEACAAFPDAAELGDIIDLDEVLEWCSKPQPKPIESVDQSDRFWEVIAFLDELEECALLDDEAVCVFRSADDVAFKFLSARLNFIASAADLSVEESTRLQAVFEMGIAALRRALPELLSPTSAPEHRRA